jgi:hypothetical protein
MKETEAQSLIKERRIGSPASTGFLSYSSRMNMEEIRSSETSDFSRNHMVLQRRSFLFIPLCVHFMSGTWRCYLNGIKMCHGKRTKRLVTTGIAGWNTIAVHTCLRCRFTASHTRLIFILPCTRRKLLRKLQRNGPCLNLCLFSC